MKGSCGLLAHAAKATSRREGARERPSPELGGSGESLTSATAILLWGGFDSRVFTGKLGPFTRVPLMSRNLTSVRAWYVIFHCVCQDRLRCSGDTAHIAPRRGDCLTLFPSPILYCTFSSTFTSSSEGGNFGSWKRFGCRCRLLRRLMSEKSSSIS